MQQQEEWMILSQLQPTFQQDHSTDSIDWSEASHELRIHYYCHVLTGLGL